MNVSLAELVEREEVAADFDLDGTRKKVDDLRSRLESFGAINMLAVDELEETEERLLFLTSQRQDIVDSIQSTEEALKEIKERSRAKFKEAFEAINANFVQYFQELFGGGRGEMTLLESEDILEAGIEIVAQPPGKRLQNILLLSGGEKAMTAIALVLAIFKYRPAPFCLLDEVDAAARRSQRRPVRQQGRRDVRKDAVHRYHPQQTHDGSRPRALRRDDAGSGCFKDCFGEVRLI